MSRVLAISLAISTLLLSGLPARARAQTMELITPGANSGSGRAAISADDRYVAFGSSATNLVPGAGEGLYIHDRVTGTTVYVGPGFHPSLSADGRYVAFESYASTLVPGDTNGVYDVFRYDRDADADGVFDEPGAVAMIRVSVGPGGVQANGASCYDACCTGGPSISADGNLVAFDSAATNLVAGGDANGSAPDCFVRDVLAGTTLRVSQTAAGVQGNGGSVTPRVSGNGAYVAFTTWPGTTNLFPGDTNGEADVVRKNLASGAIELVSLGLVGAPANGYSAYPWISDDGSVIAFGSAATNLTLVPDGNGATDAFVRNMVAGVTTLASISVSGSAAGCPSPPSIGLSGDGNVVSFQSDDCSLWNGGPLRYTHVFARNLATGITVLVDRTPAGAEGNAYAGFLLNTLSGDGSHLAFAGQATNLVTPDPNGTSQDVFVAGDLFAGAAPALPCTGADVAFGAGCPAPGLAAPVLAVDCGGCVAPGGVLGLRVSAFAPGPAFLLFGLVPFASPLSPGCFVHVTPILPLFLVSNPSYTSTGTFAIPIPPGAVGSLVFQSWVVDPAAPGGLSGSNGLVVTI